MIGPTEIAQCYRQRENDASKAVERMGDVAKAYKGDDIIDIADLYRGAKPAAANIVYTALTQTGMRIAAPDPILTFPPVRPGFKGSEQRAEDRRRVAYSWFEQNQMGHLRLQRALWFLAFLRAPVVIRPDVELGGPRWELRDPRRFFPSDGGMRPADAVARSSRPYAWLRQMFPDAAERMDVLYKRDDSGQNRGWDGAHRVGLLEWWDESECVLVALGDEPGEGMTQPLAPEQKAAVLERYPNLAGVCPVVSPTPVSLDPDDPRSQFDGMLGSFKMRARLLALSYLAVEKGIFAEEWLEGRMGEEPEIRQVPDPRQGIIGVTVGGAVRRNPTDPQFASLNLSHELEAAERASGSAPAEYGGEGSTNVRTGRRGAQVLGAAIDFFIQTAQLRFTESMRVELDTAVRIDKAYFGNVEKTGWTDTKGARGPYAYRPNDLWETAECRVRFPFAGVDLSNITMEAGQLVGLEALSRQSLMEVHPLVADVEVEKDRITAENLERAFFAQLMTMAADPNSPVTMSMLTKLRELVLSDKVEWWEAWSKIQADAQEAQAQQAAGQMEPPMPGIDGGLVPPGPVAAPEQSMPGIQELGNALMAQRRAGMRAA